MEIIIYTKPNCPYCQKARDYYQTKGIAFDDRNAQDIPKYRVEMLRITAGDPTVPVIVEGGVLAQIGWNGLG